MNVITVKNSAERQDAFSVRTKVFVHEQHVPEEKEKDEYDQETTHFVAYDQYTPVGAGRLRLVEQYGKVERVCVLKAYRNSGLGKQVMTQIEATAKKQGLSLLKLHAQTHAQDFYSSIGYQTCSGEFLDAGIPHVAMKKQL